MASYYGRIVALRGHNLRLGRASGLSPRRVGLHGGVGWLQGAMHYGEKVGADGVLVDGVLEPGREGGQGLVGVVRCAEEDEELFLSLVVGAAAETLDDGEAATLVYAARSSSIAVIDERKATSLSASRFPGLGVWSTLDVLLRKSVVAASAMARLSVTSSPDESGPCSASISKPSRHRPT